MKELVKMTGDWDDHNYKNGDVGYLLGFSSEDYGIVRLIKTKRGSGGKPGMYVTVDLDDLLYIGDESNSENSNIL